MIKQARPQLRTRQAWFSNVERNWREADVLRICAGLLEHDDAPATTRAPATPRILFEDRANYLFAMAAAPSPHRVWKHDLLAGKIDPAVAVACGHLLGRLHAGSWQDPAIAGLLGDRTLFAELRDRSLLPHAGRRGARDARRDRSHSSRRWTNIRGRWCTPISVPRTCCCSPAA